MRIVFFCVHEGGFWYEWPDVHIEDELRKGGHEYLKLNPIELLGHTADVATYSQVMLEAVRRYQLEGGVDLFFAMATDWMVDPEAIREVGRMGIPTINLSAEDYSEPERIRQVAPSFDISWSTVPENVELLRSWGANVLALPFAANPHFFKPMKIREEPVIGFAGSVYGGRLRKMAHLTNARLPLRINGDPPWKHHGGTEVRAPLLRAFKDLPGTVRRLRHGATHASGRKLLRGMLKRSLQESLGNPIEKQAHVKKLQFGPHVDFGEMPRLLQSSAVNLGDIELRSTFVLKKPLLFIRVREFEAPMSGALHLVDRKPELQGYFEEDREMIFYTGVEEMIDKARFYLSPRQERLRRSIRERARARAVAEHTWTERFKRAGEPLGLKF